MERGKNMLTTHYHSRSGSILNLKNMFHMIFDILFRLNLKSLSLIWSCRSEWKSLMLYGLLLHFEETFPGRQQNFGPHLKPYKT